MSRRKQPNPKPLKVGEEDLLSDDDDDDELVIFEDSSDGEDDTQDEFDSGDMELHTAQGSEEENQDIVKEEILEGHSTYRRLRPKRKCTTWSIPPEDGHGEAASKKLKTGELFPCPTCSKGFKTPSEMQIHMRKHTGEKPFCCPFCNKAYPRRKTMYRHIREHHPDQWQRGRFPGRFYHAAINKAIEDTLRQDNTSALGAAPGTGSSAVTGAEDQSKMPPLTIKQEPTTPPTTPGKKSPLDSTCGKYKRIAPAPLKPQLAVVQQMPVSTPLGVQQQFFLVNPQTGVIIPINMPPNTNLQSGMAVPMNPQSGVASPINQQSGIAVPINQQSGIAVPTNQQSGIAVPINQQSGVAVPINIPTNTNLQSNVAVPMILGTNTNPQSGVAVNLAANTNQQSGVAVPSNPQPGVAVPMNLPTNTNQQSGVAVPSNPQPGVAVPMNLPTNTNQQSGIAVPINQQSGVAIPMNPQPGVPLNLPTNTNQQSGIAVPINAQSGVTVPINMPTNTNLQSGVPIPMNLPMNTNPQSGIAVPINPQSGVAFPVAMVANQQNIVQTSFSPVAMPTNPQAVVQTSAFPVAMPTNQQAVVQTSSPSVAMPTNPQMILQTSSSPVAMPTNPQSVLQTSSPSVAMPTNPQMILQTSSSPVAMPTNPQAVMQSSSPCVAMPTNPQAVLQTSPSPVAMPTQATPMQTCTTPTTSVAPRPVVAVMQTNASSVTAHNQQANIAMATASLPTRQAMPNVVMTTLPSSVTPLDQPSHVTMTTAAMATNPTPPTPVLQQVVMPRLIPVQQQTPQVSMVTVSKATVPSQHAPRIQQAILPKVFQAQNQGKAIPVSVMPQASLPAQSFSSVAMTASSPSQVASATTAPAVPPVTMPTLFPVQNQPVAITTSTSSQITTSTTDPVVPAGPPVTMPTLFPVQNQPAQVAVTTVCQAPLPTPTLSQVASSPKPLLPKPILPAMTSTARTPTPIAPVIQHFLMPAHSSVARIAIATSPSVSPVAMATQPTTAVTTSSAACLTPAYQRVHIATDAAPLMQHFVLEKSPKLRSPIRNSTNASPNQPLTQKFLCLRTSTSHTHKLPVLTQQSSTPQYGIPLFSGATLSSTSVTNTMPVLQIQNVVTLTSSQSQAIPVQLSMATVARQQASPAVMSPAKERNIGEACQISQTLPSPGLTEVRSGATESNACLPNLDVDSDEYFIAGGKSKSVYRNEHGEILKILRKEDLNRKQSETGEQNTPATAVTPESQQSSTFHPVLPEMVDSRVISDCPKDDRGQYRPLTVEVLERSNTCSLCGSMLRSLRYLIMHLFKFHRQYKCRLCAPRVSKTFASEQLLKDHLLNRHWPVLDLPDEEAARGLHYHFKRSCQAVEAVRVIGNPLDVTEITGSDIRFKDGKTLKYRVNYNILTPGRYMNDGDITVKRTNTNALSITCIFFHTSSVLKGGNAKKAYVSSKLVMTSAADGPSMNLIKRRNAPPNVAVLPKGMGFKAMSSTRKEGGLGTQTSNLSKSNGVSSQSPKTASASLSAPQSTSSASCTTTSKDQSTTEGSSRPAIAVECHGCDVCGQVFSELQELQQHMNVHIELKPFKCNLCSRTFPHGATLEAHVKAHYRGEIEDEPTTIPANVKISFCTGSKKGGSTSEKRNRDNLEEEGATADSEDDPSNDGTYNICRLCGKTYSNGASLIRHLRTHQEGFEMSCSICGKGFNLSYHLKEHMNVHTKTKPYKCHICGKSFTHSGTLSAHLKSHKSREGIVAEYSSFGCRYCSVHFTHIKKYQEHMKERHGVFDFDFEEAEKDIIKCNASREENPPQSCLESENTAEESESDKSQDVPAVETAVENTDPAASKTQANTLPASVVTQAEETLSISTPPLELNKPFKASRHAIQYQTGKTVAELIGLRKTKPTVTETPFTNVTQSSGEPPPLVITQAISLRPFVDKIIAASVPDPVHMDSPNVTKFKPILPKAYIQPLTTFQISPGAMPEGQNFSNEYRWKMKHLDKSSEGQNSSNEFTWKIKHFNAVQPVDETESGVNQQNQMTKFKYGGGQEHLVDPYPWFKCRKCGVGYSSKLHLRHHICGACSKYMMKCEDCDLTFFSFRRLENHLAKEHPEEYNEDYEQSSGESEEEGDGVEMEEQREQESRERRSSTQDEANSGHGQVVVKVEQIDESSLEPTDRSAVIKQEELEGQKWWFEGDDDGDLERNKMADCEVKVEEEDAGFERVNIDDLDMEAFVQFSERKENTVDGCGEQQLDDFRPIIKTEAQSQVSDQLETIGQHGSQSKSRQVVPPHPPDQSVHRDSFQERRQMDQSHAKEESPSVHESKFVDQTDNVVLDIHVIQNSQSERTIEGISQPGDIEQKKDVDVSGSPQVQLYRCMLCGSKEEKLLAPADLARHLTEYHHVENPEVFLQGPMSCFSTGKN